MNFKKKKTHLLIISLLLAAVTVFQITALSGCAQTDSKELLQKAKELYDNGNVEEAEYQLSLYIQDYPTDVEANILLGDWYTADNNDKALMYYRKAAKYIEYAENSLNYNNSSVTLNGGIESFTIKPAAKYTKSMKVTFSGNMFRIDKDSDTGKINKAELQLDDSKCKTTKWFAVNASEKTISAYGNMNCAVWQFMDDDGNIDFYDDESDFNSYNSIRVSNKAYSYAEIPEDAVSARLTYYDPSVKNTNTKLNNGVFAEYGSFIQGYTSVNSQTLEIPDLSGNEYIEYKNGKWTLYSGNKKTELKLGTIPKTSLYVSVSGELVGELEYTCAKKSETKADKSKEYGISYKSGTTDFSCRRIGDAVNMSFNYKIDDTWANNGSNDFDNAYPWCEMKRCNIKITNGKKIIVYENEKGYKNDGSNGNVMVEIPKFYTKRTVEDGYESIMISGTMHEGYQLDPAFIGTDGSELEHIYVAAYPSAIDEKSGLLTSSSESFPAIKLLYKDTQEKVTGNGKGYTELDFVTYSALQKLFLIETGNINSSSIFSGDTANFYFYADSDKSGYATNTEKNTNTIILKLNTLTERLAVGDSITIFSGWSEYKNTAEYHREIESLSENENEIMITFTGNPIDIEAGKTAISNIPLKCGKTDSIEYCTGINQRGDGKSSFKYRGMENLYGSVMTVLSGASFSQEQFTYTTADGTSYTVYAEIPVQTSGFSGIENLNKNLCIKSMIYDSENPLVMLPSELGKGASSTSAYGDFWMQFSKETSATARYLAVGGANDNFSLAGIFHMRAFIDADATDNTNSGYIGSRIMFR